MRDRGLLATLALILATAGCSVGNIEDYLAGLPSCSGLPEPDEAEIIIHGQVVDGHQRTVVGSLATGGVMSL